MTSLRVQLAVPVAIVAAVFGICLSFIVLASLRSQLAVSLRATAERQAIALQSSEVELRTIRPILPPGTIVVRFASDRRPEFSASPEDGLALAEIAAPEDVPRPDAFLRHPYVGVVLPRSRPEGAPSPNRSNQVGVLLATGKTTELYREIRIRLILAVMAGIAGLILTSIGISGSVVRRIRDLTVSVKNIEAHKPLPESIRTRPDELGDLGAELEKTRETLYEKGIEIARLQKVRSEFLANVSHEVRTPLFSLRGFLETLLEGGMDDPRVSRSFLEKANHHAQRLDALLKDLIEISRIESGDMRMSFRYFAVAPFLRLVFEDHKDAASRKGMQFQMEVSEERDVLGDKDRLRQVLDNLLDNAVSYCPPGTRIVLRCTAGEKTVTFSVSDSGPGIPPEHLPRIFERFYRVDADRSREVGGTGLGLAIVKHIVEAHGSSVRVHSVIGRGTSFEFDIQT